MNRTLRSPNLAAMELRQLRYFLEILRHASFGRAADALHITQPALSKSLRTLEAELGVKLLERSARGVIATPYGRILESYAGLAARELERAVEEIKALAGRGGGVVRVLREGVTYQTMNYGQGFGRTLLSMGGGRVLLSGGALGVHAFIVRPSSKSPLFPGPRPGATPRRPRATRRRSGLHSSLGSIGAAGRLDIIRPWYGLVPEVLVNRSRNDVGAAPPANKALMAIAAVLLAVPIVGLLWVSSYAKAEPVVAGFPFFIWYQFLWVFLCSALTYTAYRIVLVARPHRPMDDLAPDGEWSGERGEETR